MPYWNLLAKNVHAQYWRNTTLIHFKRRHKNIWKRPYQKSLGPDVFYKPLAFNQGGPEVRYLNITTTTLQDKGENQAEEGEKKHQNKGGKNIIKN